MGVLVALLIGTGWSQSIQVSITIGAAPRLAQVDGSYVLTGVSRNDFTISQTPTGILVEPI